MRNKAVILTAGVMVLFGGIAQAKLVSFSTDEIYSWSSSGAVITQAISDIVPNDVIMTADADSIFTIVSSFVNESGFTWTGYMLTLDPTGNATFVNGTASSTKFHTVNYPDLWTLQFLAPDAVAPGHLVALQFDLRVPDGPPYTFKLTHQPIPEPATLALLGLGALVLVTGRRK